MENEIKSGEYQLGEYIIAYKGNNFKLIEINHEGNKGIMFTSEEMSEIIGVFLYDSIESKVIITELYSRHYSISDKRIEIEFRYE